MGIFDSETTTETSLRLPNYMRDLPELLANQARGLIGQDYLTPDQLVAGLDPALLRGINQMINYGEGAGRDVAGAITQTGMQGIGGFGAGQQALFDVLGQGPSQNMGVDMGRVGSYIDNDVINQQINAALRDPTRQFTEQQLPSARLAAAGGGSTGSTRRDIGEAILQRGYEDRAADIAGSIRGDAYRQALGIGAQEASQNAALGAGYQSLTGQVGQSLIGSGMNAANLLQAGQGLDLNAIRAVMGGGQMLTDQQQRMLDAGKEGYLWDYQSLGQLAPLIGQMGQTFGTQVSSQTQDQGWGNTLLGVAGTIGGAMLGGPAGAMMGASLFGGGGGGMSGSPSAGTGSFSYGGNPFASDPFASNPYMINPYGGG